MAQPGDKSQSAEPAEEAPRAVTNEDVHGAISERLKRFEGKIDTQFKSYESKMSAILEKLESRTSAATELPAGEQASATNAAKDDAAKAIKEAEARFKSRMDAMQAEREQEKLQARTQEERSELQRHLSGAGITDPRYLKASMAVLSEEKRIGRNTEGKIIFKGVDKYGDEAEYDLAEGVTQWVNSDDGKPYLPAKEVSGSGSRPSKQRAGQPSTKQSAAERKAEATQAIFDNVRKAFTGR